MNLSFRPLKIFLSGAARLAGFVLMLSALPAGAADPEPASPATPANSERTVPDGAKTEILLEERLVNKGVWLGDNDQNRFLGLYNAAVTTTSKGNVLLIGYAGARPDNFGELGTLWRSLAELGWNTLLIPLPVLPEKPIPQRGQVSSATDSAATANAATPADSAATAKSTATPPSSGTEAYSRLLQDWQTQSRQRVEAGLAHLRKSNQQDAVIITEGIAAQFSLQTFSEAQYAKLIQRLAVIDANPLGLPEELKNSGAKATDPANVTVLEIQTRPHPEMMYSAARRNNASARQRQFTRHQLLRLPPASIGSMQGENMLTRRVRGWLEKYS